MNRSRASSMALGVVVCALGLFVLVPVIVPDRPWPTAARDLLAARGFDNTGAGNLVSAIYLGYRAYDTLGETVVLLAALAGAIALTGAAAAKHEETNQTILILRSPADQDAGQQPRRPPHTEIINVVAGKLAPIVLVFGCYVMLYGHVSPGGGFQGGVVLASGIVFIAIGRRSGGIGRIDPSLSVFGSGSLSRMEGISFAAILLLSFPGLGEAVDAALSFASSGTLVMPRVAYIIALNMAIGLKVGSGVALMCVLMLGRKGE